MSRMAGKTATGNDEFTPHHVAMTSNQSLRRPVRSIDIACAGLYLASDEASWATTVNLPVDGGYTAR